MIKYFRMWLGLLLMLLLIFSVFALFAHAQGVDQVRPRDAISRQHITRAHDYFNRKQYGRVIELLEPVLMQMRDNTEVQRLLGHAAFEIGRYDLASQAYGNVIAQGEFSGDILGRVAEIERNAGRLYDAIAVLRLAILAEPEFPGFREGLAGLLIDVGEYQQAWQLLDSLINRQPYSATLHAQMGNLYIRKDQPERALSYFLTAYYLGLDDTAAMETIASLYVRQGEKENALVWYERILERADKPGVRLLRASMLFEFEQFDESLKEAQRLLHTDVKDDARHLIIRIALKNNDHDTAAMHREQVSSKKDTWIRAIDIELANHFYRKNEFQKAGYHYQNALTGGISSQATMDKQVLYPLIMCLIETGAVDDAWQYLRVYLKQAGADVRFKELLDKYLRLL